MSGFMVYWSKDYVKELKAAGDSGPIKVIYGGPHSTMPSIESVEVGDIIYPVTIANNTLCVWQGYLLKKRNRFPLYSARNRQNTPSNSAGRLCRRSNKSKR